MLAFYLQRSGEILTAAGRVNEAVVPLRRRLELVEGLTDAEPHDARWRRELALALFQLAQAGDEPRPRLLRARELLRALAAQGALDASQADWIDVVEKALAELPP